MNFNLIKSIELLSRTPETYKTLLFGVSNEWDNVNEGTDSWSAFDIVGHLIYGEKADWIPRAMLILESKDIPEFVPFDRFAQKKLNLGKSLDELLIEFVQLRKQNIAVLKGWELNSIQLKKQGLHPELGLVTLQELIATWTIHDMGHLNQLSRVFVKHYQNDVGPWTAYSKLLKRE